MRASSLLRDAVGRVGIATHAARISDAALYGSEPCLRIAVLHSVGGAAFDRFCRFVETVEQRVEVVGPDEVESLDRGDRRPLRKEVAFSFDDGFANNFRAARWLADRGIRGFFFVVPSLLGRAGDGYLAHHASRGVEAFLPVDRYEPTHGLAPTQVREMAAMGHRIGLHPDAHRSLGRLTAAEVRYDVATPKNGLEDLLGDRVSHFAYAFGHARDASPTSESVVRAEFAHVHFACRGGNRVHAGPQCLLRDNVDLDHPPRFALLALLGGIDALYTRERRDIARLVGTKRA